MIPKTITGFRNLYFEAGSERRYPQMKPLFKGLDTETQLLVAVGSAVASGCIPCLESITGLALAENIDEKKMRAAAIIGQFVKDQPANNMKAKADELLGTHL